MSTWLAITVAFGVFVLLAGCWLGWQLLRQNGRLLLRLEELEKRLNELEVDGDNESEGLPVGCEAPAFELADLAGERKSFAQFRGQPVLMIFLNPDCGFCRELMPKLAALPTRSSRPEEAHTSNFQPNDRDPSLVTSAATNGNFPGCRALPLIITTGDAGANRQLFDEHSVRWPVLLQNDGEVAKAYQVNGTPAGYLVSAEGKIVSVLAIGAEALLKLASEPPPDPRLNLPAASEKTTNGTDGRANRFSQRSVARSKIRRDGLRAGTPAPVFRLPRVDASGELSLEELRGRRVLLVFSSPQCGPCHTLAPELERFHREHPEIEVVMISKGEPKENRARVKEHGLTFPVVLQQQWEISRRYAMFATPIAYLIDDAGIITHDVAVGVEPILALTASIAATDLAPVLAQAP